MAQRKRSNRPVRSGGPRRRQRKQGFSLSALLKNRKAEFKPDSTGGNWSGLAQDIAREVFQNETRGIHFCTAPVAANGTGE
jgi:hypothetical protein